MQKIEALGWLAGGIAHDLNNALVPVLALAKRAHARLPEDSRERGMLDLVIEGAHRAKALVQQILAFSRKEVPVQGPLDFSALVRHSIAMLRASLPTTIRLVTDIAPVGKLYGDAGQLHQVLVNLVTNAAHSIGLRQGTITLTLNSAGDRAKLSVVDDGAGMEASVLARVFEPFFTTKPVGEGTGLGLSVVHGIVTNHDGTISVESKLNAGARFDVLLPLLPD